MAQVNKDCGMYAQEVNIGHEQACDQQQPLACMAAAPLEEAARRTVQEHASE